MIAKPIRWKLKALIAVCVGTLLFFPLAAVVNLWTQHNSSVHSGYTLFQADTTVVLTHWTGEVVVGTQIVLIGTSDNLIIGKTDDPNLLSLPYDDFPVGYFVVDTKNGKITSGLTLTQFESLIGIGRKIPRMYSPETWALTHW